MDTAPQSLHLLLAAVELAVDEVEEEVDVDARLPEHVHHCHALVLQLQQLLHEVIELIDLSLQR